MTKLVADKAEPGSFDSSMVEYAVSVPGYAMLTPLNAAKVLPHLALSLYLLYLALLMM